VRPSLRVILCGLPLLCGAFACQPTPICEGRSLQIVEPDDGELVPPGEVNIVVEVCDFEPDEQIRIRLLEPTEADYAFILVEDPEQRLYGRMVPTLGTTMSVVAESFDGETTSEVVRFDVDAE
jgi:hypothetical protein